MFTLKKLYYLFFGKKNEESIRVDLSKYFLSWGFFLLFSALLLYLTINFLLFGYSLRVVLNEMISIFLIFFFVIFISNYFLLKFVDKYIISRFKEVESGLFEVREGNYSKRVKEQGGDEFGILVNFINLLLERVERSIENEKRYSLIDSLTKTYNRRALFLNFESIKSNSLRQGYDFSLALLDIDNFKKINEIFDYGLGDRILKRIAKLIKKEIRSDDFFCRFGGDEFLIIFLDTSNEKTKELITRIIQIISLDLKKSFKELKFEITISAGHAHSSQYNLYDSTVLNNMIVSANKDLRESKTFK